MHVVHSAFNKRLRICFQIHQSAKPFFESFFGPTLKSNFFAYRCCHKCCMSSHSVYSTCFKTKMHLPFRGIEDSWKNLKIWYVCHFFLLPIKTNKENWWEQKMCMAGKGVIIDADIMHTTELQKLQHSCKKWKRENESFSLMYVVWPGAL